MPQREDILSGELAIVDTHVEDATATRIPAVTGAVGEKQARRRRARRAGGIAVDRSAIQIDPREATVVDHERDMMHARPIGHARRDVPHVFVQSNDVVPAVVDLCVPDPDAEA